MRPIVEDHLNGTFEDDLEVQRVRVMHRNLETGFVAPPVPGAQPCRHTKVHELATTGRSRRRRSLGRVEEPEGTQPRENVIESRLALFEHTGPAVTANARDDHPHERTLQAHPERWRPRSYCRRVAR